MTELCHAPPAAPSELGVPSSSWHSPAALPTFPVLAQLLIHVPLYPTEPNPPADQCMPTRRSQGVGQTLLHELSEFTYLESEGTHKGQTDHFSEYILKSPATKRLISGKEPVQQQTLFFFFFFLELLRIHVTYYEEGKKRQKQAGMSNLVWICEAPTSSALGELPVLGFQSSAPMYRLCSFGVHSSSM